MATKKRLGRGLDALLGAPGGASAVSADFTDSSVQGVLKDLAVDLIQPGKYQPRVDMREESLQELADSIRAQGVVQPIVVRPVGDGSRYEIIAGERRWRATQLAELHKIPVVIRDVPDEAAIAMALIENIQRENLNPIEEANALQRLISEFELTHQEAAEAVGRSRASVSNLLRLLVLSGEVRRMVEYGELEMGHARALLALEGDALAKAAREIVAKGLSVREAERLVRQMQEVKVAGAAKKDDPDVQRLELELSETLGAKVAIQQGTKGRGKLVINYNSLDELDGILGHIK